MKMVITTAGRAALINAAQTGTASVEITQIGVGTGKYTASETQTGLVSEIKRIDIIEGAATSDSAIHVALRDISEESYNVYEIGIFLADGTLFAVYSQTSVIATKTSTAELVLTLDASFVDVDVSSVTFGDVGYSVVAATTDMPGIVELATAEEAQAKIDARRVLTPATGASLIEAWASALFNEVAKEYTKQEKDDGN